MSVRAAVVGLGWAGRELWLPRLRSHPDFDLVAAVDPDPAARADVGAATGTPVHAEPDALDARSVDLAVVAVPNHLHTTVAARLLGRGVNVFLEKPVCLSGAEADTLAAAERDGGVLLAGSAARHRADVRELTAILPELGRVRHVDLAWIRARGVPQAGGWFTRRSEAGGGALVDLGWHLVDTLTALLGPSPVRQAVGATSDDFLNAGEWSAAWRREETAAAPTGDVEDTARGFLLREDGVSVSLRASWASHEARDLSLIRIEGSAGTAELRCTFGFSPNRQPESVLTLTREGTTRRLPVPAEPVGAEYGRQLDGVPALLADPAGRGRAIAEARTTVRLMERIYASARADRDRPGEPVYQQTTSR
ncbi:Gfo/Idh/MocA family protein [Streptomyces naphthomycinicus]|uniref:Gfo/Idh/MocA family protein n=1 Tax=Streptomyces naphthomycinicus TaxID=2872625 RepID=UPI001CED4D20|nr:Gfo/Idh/MocA family oxidoreductase [Streptomyces sp. TML10]